MNRSEITDRIMHSKTYFEGEFWRNELIAFDEAQEAQLDLDLDFHGDFDSMSLDEQDAIINHTIILLSHQKTMTNTHVVSNTLT